MIANDGLQLESRRFDGTEPGPHLLITAGVHGDEYLPMRAVKSLIDRFDADETLRSSLRGTLTLIPVVNRSAYQRGQREGQDGKDLARTCPGRMDGSVTEQVAYELSRQIRSADYYIDLHTGGRELCVLPLAGYILHSDRTVLDQQRLMARAFGLPFVWGTSAGLEGRSLSVARDAGIPAIYVEYLGSHRELSEIAAGEPQSAHPIVSGCLNVLRHLKLLAEPEQSCAEPERMEDRRSESGHMQICNPAPATGFFVPKVELGQQVAPGDVLAEIVSETVSQTYSVIAQQAGKVVVLRTYPRINQGDSVAVIAENCEAT